jgi:hypothetical protein
MNRLLTATLFSTLVGGAAFAGTEQDSSKTNAPRFETCSTLLDATAVNGNDLDHAADIDDFVMDMRNGRAVFAIIDTNGLLGSDNKVVAVPYGAMTWDPHTQKYAINITAAQLKNLPSFDASDMSHLQDPSWFSTLRGIFDDQKEFDALEANGGDEYTWHFTQNRPETLNGTIVGVDRKAKTTLGSTCYAVLVQEKDTQKRHSVLIAPAAYLNGQAMVPVEGNEIRIESIAATNADGEAIRVARSIKVNDKTLRLRDDKGIPAWDSDPAVAARNFYKLASDIDNGVLYAQSEKFGDLTDIVLEAKSGTAAFAIVSTGGLLGVGDTLYPVPCAAVSHGSNQKLYSSKSIDELKRAPKLSDNGVNDLNDDGFMKRVCDYYGVSPKEFDTKRSLRWKNAERITQQ